jgi:hypothetical protein
MNAGADADHDNKISKDEFMNMLNDKRATEILHEVGVDVIGLVDFADTIFGQMPGEENLGEKHLTLEDFMKVILELRGDQGAKVRDIMEMRKYMNACFARFEQRLFDNAESVGHLHAKKAGKPITPASQETNCSGLANCSWAASETCNSMPCSGSPNSVGSPEMEPMSLKSLQKQLSLSLSRVQATHERELANLHAENLSLMDRLRDLGTAAGKSLERVLQVAASGPETEKATAPPFPIVEQPQVQAAKTGMDGIPLTPREAVHPSKTQEHSGCREPAKQETGSYRLSMDMLKQEARQSLANVCEGTRI